jgi:hypothetical protein
MEIEDRLIYRHRDKIGDLEGERLAQLGLLHPWDVRLANHNLLVRDTQCHVLAGELGLAPELLKSPSDNVDVDNFSVVYGSHGHRDLAEAVEPRTVSSNRQLRGANTGGPDVETDSGSCTHDVFSSYPELRPDRNRVGFQGSVEKVHRMVEGFS